jgi:hypothetical protein
VERKEGNREKDKFAEIYKEMLESAKLQLHDENLKVRKELLLHNNNFNLRGAIELAVSDIYRRMVDKNDVAKMLKAGGMRDGKPVQAIIDFVYKHKIKNADGSTLKALIGKLADKYKQRAADVESTMPHLYHELSKYAHGNQCPIIISNDAHSISEVLGFAAVLKYNGWEEVSEDPCGEFKVEIHDSRKGMVE